MYSGRHSPGPAAAGNIAVGSLRPSLQQAYGQQAPSPPPPDLADDRAQLASRALSPRLDAIAAQLDLPVYPAQILDAAVAAQQARSLVR